MILASMEFLYAFLGGLTNKIYDDLILDNKIIKSEILEEIFKGFQWIMLTLISVNDFNLSFTGYTILLGNSFLSPNGFAEPYDKSILILYPLLLIISFSTRTYLTTIDIIIYVICLFITGILDPMFTKHEVSPLKLGFRLLFFIACGSIILLSNYFDISISKSVITILYYISGYTLFSCCFQFYCLFIEDLTGTLKKEVEMRPEIQK